MPFLKSNVPIPLPFIQFILQKTDPCWWIKTLHLEYWDSNHRHCFLKCIISKSKTKTTVSTYLTRLEPRVKRIMQNLMRLELGLQVLLDLQRAMQGMLNDDIDENAWGAFLGIQALEKISHCMSSISYSIYIIITRWQYTRQSISVETRFGSQLGANGSGANDTKCIGFST